MRSFLKIVVLILISLAVFNVKESCSSGKSEIMTYAEAASRKDADFVKADYAHALRTFAFLLSEQRAEVAVGAVIDNLDKSKSFLVSPPFVAQTCLSFGEWIDSQPIVNYLLHLWYSPQKQDVYTLKHILI